MSSTGTKGLGLLASFKSHERAFMVLVAILIGALGGFGAVGFRWLITAIQSVAWGSWEFTMAGVSAHPVAWIIAVPTLGGLIVGPMVHFLAREAKGHGVPEVMEAVALRSGYMRARLVVVKSLASAISIATGASVGREGPIVQIGSAIGSVTGQILKVSGMRLRTLVGCGAAAGIAATFNAPVAGALFAVEVILGDFGISRFSPIVISSVMATVVSRTFLGDVPAFIVPTHEMVSPYELVIYMFLGVVAALVAVLFIRLLYGMEDLADRAPIPHWLLTPIGGLMIGTIGLAFPQIFGVGYEAIESALRGELALTLLATLLAVKLFATSLSIAAGFSGGVFAPSLFLGAMTGGLVGKGAHFLFPSMTATTGAYALVGMGAVVAAATQAPITAILIIFELTSDYRLILPLMASCIIATLFAEKLKPESIYTRKLVRRGVNLRRGQEVNVLRSLKVRSGMRSDMLTLPGNETFGALLARVTESPSAYMYVTNKEDRLEGVITLSEVSSHFPDAPLLSNLLLARDIARDDVPSVSPEDSLDTAMRILRSSDREEIPVVDPESHKLVGVISHRQLVEGYNRELLKRDMAAELGATLQASGRVKEEIPLGDDFSMVEMDAPGEFLDKSIRDLDVRGRYDVQVLLIHRPPPGSKGMPIDLAPGPETVILRGDRLVVMGKKEDLARVRSL